ncbi:hypothetical protein DFH09DRAFT_1360600 [Mycena vulgaris]|nr:hypothetical protein DFH09DRAFT_1360600 [Mycena vulgaris]
MKELGVDYIGSGECGRRIMVPLSDERWQTVLGKAILADVSKIRTAEVLERAGRSASGANSPEEAASPFQIMVWLNGSDHIGIPD